ncbi:MAG: phosphatidylinositol-3-phosphatase [Chamaesiphon sp.]
MSIRRTYKTLILALTALSWGFTIIGCSSKEQVLGKIQSQQNKLKAVATPSKTTAQGLAVPKYKHIFVIIEENKAYEQIIDSPNAPTINKLAQTYGLATNFFGEVHPSEANYVAMLGGSTFGIHDDAPYNANSSSLGSHGVEHTISSRSLLDQLEEKGLTWKGYFEDIPYPGYKGTAYPSPSNALYASKHNGFLNFKKVQNTPQELAKLVGIDQLIKDLQSDVVPNYSHIILNQCHEMHGLPQCRNTSEVIRIGDTMVGKIVDQITSSRLWSSLDNNAIIITWDEDNGKQPYNQGCCGYDPKSTANFGGGHIPTIVITNHGPRNVKDNTPYNHYSLLRTTEDAFGIHEYLNYAGDTKDGVKSMTPLFAVSRH